MKRKNGSISERAFQKAKQIYTRVDKNDFQYIIGLDDGVKMKGKLRENVKDYIQAILDDKYLAEGEQVDIVRAYCFIEKNGTSNTVITEIPFRYKKINRKIELKEHSYPLSNVLMPFDSNKTVAEMDKEENNQYYLKYSEKKIKEVLS